jgi:hypothetical protein
VTDHWRSTAHQCDRAAGIGTAFYKKTIDYIDTTSLNYWVFHFTDGTTAAIDTEHMGHNIHGPVVSKVQEEVYIVGVKEVHVSLQKVLASSEEEAILRAKDGKGEEVTRVNEGNLPPEEWTVVTERRHAQ